ncbi:flippase [Thermococcus paralvinellae]|uniref:Polysaccharide biosynthesis protein n=1 Tax=Thermococcus paralvinellae TaxID=582419 RepID=W0I9W2_9EURY|nr:flippase [Thermococcus paralvinellae]AHF81265.1 polysaccharide biosynthesis protein [Thermococcus paralvinellae]
MAGSLKLKLIKNAGWLFSAEVISKILAYGLIILLGRTLGEEGLGQYSFIFSFVALTSIFSDLGVSFYVMREIARDKSKKEWLFPYALGFKIILALINFGVIVFLTMQLDKPNWMKWLIVLVAFENMFFRTVNLFTYIMFAYEVTKYEAIAKTLERVWAFFIGGAVLYLKRELAPFVVTLVVGYFVREFLRIYWGSKFLEKLSMRVNIKIWLNILKHSYPFWLIGIFTMIYYRTDIVMLGLMKNDYDVGIYRGAYTLIEVPIFIPSIVVSTTLPSMARLWREDRKTLDILFKKSFQMLLILGIAGTLGFFFFSDLAINIVFGSGFRESVGVLKVLGFAVPFMFLNSLFGSFLNATGRELTFTKITAFTALINVVLNYFLIQSYSYYGAAIATVVSQFFASFLAIIKMRDEFK